MSQTHRIGDTDFTESALSFGHWDLEFVWDLELEIWDFNVRARRMRIADCDSRMVRKDAPQLH